MKSSRRSIVFVILIVLIGISSFFLTHHRAMTSIEAKIKLSFAEIKDDYGLTIHYRYDSKNFFPKGSFYAATGSGASLWHVESLIPLIDSFLSKYPKDVVENNLSDIYLLGKMELHGKSYGGTYKGSGIYITRLWPGFCRKFDPSVSMPEKFLPQLLYNERSRSNQGF